MRKIAFGLMLLMVGAAFAPSFADDRKYDYFFLEAARQQAAGKYSAAFSLLEHAKRLNPNAAEVYFSLSMYYSYSQMGKDSLALAYLQKAVALNPDNQTYLEYLARYYVGKQQYDKAIEAYESLYERNHENGDALHVLLQLYEQQKNYPMMLQTIDRLIVEEGEDEQLALSKMRVYEMMDDKKAAYRELKTLSEAHPLDMVYKVMLGNWLVQHDRQKEAYKLFMAVLKEEPDNSYAQSSLYDYYNAVGKTAEAQQMLYKILLGKKTDNDTKMLMVRSFIQENESKGGDSTKVLDLFDKILDVPQPSSDIAFLRATYMGFKKMPEDSVNHALQKVLDIAPDNASARLQLIQNLWNKKDYDSVIAMSQSGHAYNPEDMAFYYFGGMAYYQKKQEDATLDEFKRGVAQVNSQTSPDLVSDLYMIMGDILYKKNKPEEAFAAYDSCLQWKADNYSGLNNYAYYLSVVGKDLHKAETMSYKAIKAEPKNGTYLDTYAWILFMEERYAEAKFYMDQAVSNLDSTESALTVYEHAGDVYAMNGLTDQALQYWKKAYDGGQKTETLAWKIENKRYISEEELKKSIKKQKNRRK